MRSAGRFRPPPGSRSLAGLLALAASALGAGAAEQPPGPPPPAVVQAWRDGLAPGHSSLDPLLNQLVAAQSRAADDPVRRGLLHLVDERGSVEVVAVSRPDRAQELRQAVSAVGGTIITINDDLVFAHVPVEALAALADAEPLLRLRTPIRREPVWASEGVRLHNALPLHGVGTTGAGASVGVLDCAGFAGFAPLLGEELPDSVPLWPDGTTGDLVGTSDHGTACAEIVHDMAPGAGILLAHDGSEADFYAAVDWLVGQDVDVISYSCHALGPFPHDGAAEPHNSLNATVAAARAAGTLWVGAAGNSADGEVYLASFAALPDSDWHGFAGSWRNRWGPLHAGSTYHASLSWDDWPADPQLAGASHNYDLSLWRHDGTSWIVVASSTNPQTGEPGQLPYEEISFTPGETADYHLAVSRVAAVSSRFLNLRTFGPAFEHSVTDRTVAVPAESADALAVGAVHWVDLALEPFSSRGPTLGPGGSPQGGLLKPDLVAADGVTTATRGSSDREPWPGRAGFFGTSAAAPHVAGAAAMLLELDPELEPDGLAGVLLATAVDLGAPGPDPLFGAGMAFIETDVIFADTFESGGLEAWSLEEP